MTVQSLIMKKRSVKISININESPTTKLTLQALMLRALLPCAKVYKKFNQIFKKDNWFNIQFFKYCT